MARRARWSKVPLVERGKRIDALQDELGMGDAKLICALKITKETLWHWKHDPERTVRFENQIAVAEFFAKRLGRDIDRLWPFDVLEPRNIALADEGDPEIATDERNAETSSILAEAEEIIREMEEFWRSELKTAEPTPPRGRSLFKGLRAARLRSRRSRLSDE